MSEATCPDCGTPMQISAMWHAWENIRPKHRKAEGLKEPKKYVCPLSHSTCDLIRGLREELAEARKRIEGLTKTNDRLRVSWREDVPAARDAERDRIAQWLGRPWNLGKDNPDSYTLAYVIAAIRNNEHRSEA